MGDILVVETAFGDQLCYGCLSTLESGLWARTRPGFLSVVPTTGGAAVTGPLAPSNSFLLWTCWQGEIKSGKNKRTW